MTRFLRVAFLLLLACSLLTVSAFADMGPKPQLIVRVENAPEELYYLDILAEGAPDAKKTVSEDAFTSRMEALGIADPAHYYDFLSAVPEGWHGCLSHGSQGAPIWANNGLRGEDGIHQFSYFGVPRTYRILMRTESGETFLTDTYAREVLQSGITLDWAEKTVTLPSVEKAYAVQFLATLLPTLLVEGLLLLVFKLRSRKNVLVFLLANLATQGGLALFYAIEIVNSALRGRFYATFFAAEIVILLVERFLYQRYFDRGSEDRIFVYALTANFCTLALGFILANPLWNLIYTILTT